jgi:hypothetical protein
MLRVKEPPAPSLVNRDSVTRWARRLAVQSDVGELGVLQWSCVRSREATLCIYFFVGNLGPMVWRVKFTCR